ncbi:MAG TPA: tetratricopeptide repeat protein [Rhizomicrobium sp.]|nr:tetratricopeptide repeat protein [Rhizomicrobium sp.]
MAIWPIMAAAALLCATPVIAQQDHPDWHDTGVGGTGPLGIGAPMSGVPTMEENPYYTAKRYIDEGEYAKAIPYLDEALRRQPGRVNALAYEGYALSNLGDFSDAKSYFDQALSADADDRRTHEYLGEMYLALHNADGANHELAELTRICSGGCDEKDALAKAIADYQTKQASAAPPAKR